jgi:histidinol-phosphatase (PHP family)
MLELTLPPDHHVHTARCKHADGTPEEYIEHAIELGLPALCFTDHAPIFSDVDPAHRMRWDELDVYYEEIRALAKHYEGRIHVGVGLEVDWMPRYEECAQKVCEAHDWDFLLGSVHFVSPVNAPARCWKDLTYMIRQDPHPASVLVQNYWRAWAEAAESGLFAVMSHADIYRSIDRAPHPKEQIWAREALDRVQAAGVGVEMNTSLRRKGGTECYPANWLLEEVLKRGIPMCCGSDAHHSYQVGDGFKRLQKEFLTNPALHLLDFRDLESGKVKARP